MVSQVIVLDTGPIGLITNPKLSDQGIACNQWLQEQIKASNRVIIPEIVDYEVRRELLRANKTIRTCSVEWAISVDRIFADYDCRNA